MIEGRRHAGMFDKAVKIMATYAVSDIHGHFDEFQELLDKIAFSESDEMFVLGDIIDRGPKSASMLGWAVESAPSNIRFLWGNHEISMRYELAWNADGLITEWVRNEDGSEDGWTKLVGDAGWRAEKLIPWLDDELHEFAWTDGSLDGDPTSFLMVHAGLDPDRVGNGSGVVPDEIGPRRGRAYDHMVALGHGIGRQRFSDLVLERKKWVFSDIALPDGVAVVHGHVPTTPKRIRKMERNGIEVEGEPGRICRVNGNRLMIDCGAGRGEEPYGLGCLRLDDCSEEFVPCR